MASSTRELSRTSGGHGGSFAGASETVESRPLPARVVREVFLERVALEEMGIVTAVALANRDPVLRQMRVARIWRARRGIGAALAANFLLEAGIGLDAKVCELTPPQLASLYQVWA